LYEAIYINPLPLKEWCCPSLFLDGTMNLGSHPLRLLPLPTSNPNLALLFFFLVMLAVLSTPLHPTPAFTFPSQHISCEYGHRPGHHVSTAATSHKPLTSSMYEIATAPCPRNICIDLSCLIYVCHRMCVAAAPTFTHLSACPALCPCA
jgi:hypothetical protein